MDLGDPRESLVSLEDHATWEADNRVEERWQWGAQILDLCDLSPEDYKNSTAVTVKSIQDCGECGGGSGGGGSISNNKGVAKISEDGTFTITFDKEVASDLYAFVTFKDNDFEEYSFTVKIPKGSKKGTYNVTSISSDKPYDVTGVELGFDESGSDAGKTAKDDEYEYSSTVEGNIAGKTYALSILCTETDSLTAQDYLEIIQAQGEGFDYLASYDELKINKEGTGEAVFYAACTNVPEWMPDNVEAIYFSAHSYDFVILTQDDITEIKEDFTLETENWEKGSDITINDTTFKKWVRRDLSGAQCPYSIGDDQCEDYELSYVIKIKK